VEEFALGRALVEFVRERDICGATGPPAEADRSCCEDFRIDFNGPFLLGTAAD